MQLSVDDSFVNGFSLIVAPVSAFIFSSHSDLPHHAAFRKPPLILRVSLKSS